MGDGSEDVKDQFTGGGCGIDPLFEADQSDILFFQVFDRFQKFFERAPKSIQTNNGQAVAGARVIYQIGQARTVELSAGYHIFEHANGTGIFQTADLAAEVLIGC